MKEEDPEIHAAEGELYKRSEKVLVLFSSLGGRFLRGGITLEPHTVVRVKRQTMQLLQECRVGFVTRHPASIQKALCKVAPPVNCCQTTGSILGAGMEEGAQSRHEEFGQN